MKRSYMYRANNPDPSKRPKPKCEQRPIEKISTKEAAAQMDRFNKEVAKMMAQGDIHMGAIK